MDFIQLVGCGCGTSVGDRRSRNVGTPDRMGVGTEADADIDEITRDVAAEAVLEGVRGDSAASGAAVRPE
jgi:hypothetical protein